MNGWTGDLRYAMRTLMRAPAFALAAVLTLALGIGANVAIFSAVHGVLLRPLPFAEPDRLMALWLENQPEGIERDITSYPIFLDWQAQSRTFASMAVFTGTSATVLEGGDPEQLRGAAVSDAFFATLGVAPRLGRALGAGDTEATSPAQVVLSHGLWQRRFGAAPDVIGGTIQLNVTTYEVIGVMPAEFAWPEDAEFWIPLRPVGGFAGAMESRGSLWLSTVGRLAPGVRPDAAQAEMSAIALHLADEYPQQEGYGVLIEPLHDTLLGDVRPALLVLLGAVGFVLLIACANVANLLLARGAARRRELSVRAALGAGRQRLARQALTESVVLGVTGGALGLLLAVWGTTALTALAPAEIPRIADVSVNGVVVAFGAALSLLTGLLFGSAQAAQAWRAAPAAELRDGGRGGTTGANRWRRGLVAAEVALALVLLVGAGLLLRSFATMQQIEPGFDASGVLTLRLTAPGARYVEPAHVSALYDEVRAGFAALPGVTDVALVSTLFLSRLPNMAPVAIEGRPAPDGEAVQSVPFDAVTPGFFRTMRVPLVAGRDFDARDAAGVIPVAIVNETFVRRYFPDGHALGQRFTYSAPDSPDAIWRTIVGVAADSRRSGLIEAVRPEAYFPHAQAGGRSMTVLVRTSGDPLALVTPLREALRRVDPMLPVTELATVEQVMAEAVATRRFVALLLAGFAAVALLLAAIGIYGVLAFLVGLRTREIGVRVALGAVHGDVVGMVIRQSMAQVLPGLAVGVAAALALTRLLESQLYGVRANDPATFAAVTATLLGVALLASYVPARRAARIDPVDALRRE